MDKIILILGEQTDDIRRILDSHYSDGVTVINAFKTPKEFSEHYKNHPLRVDRIIVSEMSFRSDLYGETQELRDSLEKYFIQFNQCYFLLSNNREVNEVMKFMVEDESFNKSDRLRLFYHDTYTSKLVIDYCMNKIPRKHFVQNETQYENIIRTKIDSSSTFKLDEEDDIESSSIVVLDNDRISTRDLNEKLRNLNSLSNTVTGETWSNNRIIKDLTMIDKLLSEGERVQRFDIDYSSFYLSGKVKDVYKNVYTVTGEGRSGKTVFSYALAKSASTLHKVLVIDCDLVNLGLSALTEQQKDYATVMVLQDFKSDFKNALRTLVNTNTKLNVIASNTSTLKELGNVDPLSFLSMLAYSCMKYFDMIVIDIPINSLDKVVPLIQKSDKMILTVPTSMSGLYSTVKSINELKLLEDFPTTRKLLVPVNMFNTIKKSEPLTGRSVKQLISEVYQEVYGTEIVAMTDIEISSFDIDESLMRAVKSI